MNIKHIELVTEAKRFLKEEYDMELTVPIEFNTRLKRCLGRFRFNKVNGENVPLKIEMSVEFMKVHPKENILDVLRHELVHYALCAKGLPEAHFSDGDSVFENELKRLNVSRTRHYTGKYGKLHHYTCNSCGAEFKRKRRITATARCSCSLDSKIIYNGEIEYNHEGELVTVASMAKEDKDD